MATILVVDDDLDIQGLLQLTFEHDDHRVLVAGNGEAALALLKHERPDVIVLDVSMPKLDGWGVLEALRCDKELSHIPVVMLTAHGGRMDRLRADIEGAIQYLTKPFSPSELREEVNRVLACDPIPARRQRQIDALEQLARREAGFVEDDVNSRTSVTSPRPRITRLEQLPADRPETRVKDSDARPGLEVLSATQLGLLQTVARTGTVKQASEELGVSRSNVYASLERTARHLKIDSVPELVRLVRSGAYPVDFSAPD